MENNIVTPEKLEKLKYFTNVSKYWGIYTKNSLTQFTCTDYILDQLNPERKNNVPFIKVPPQFKDTPLDFFFNLPYNNKEFIDKLYKFFSLIETKNKFKEKSILAVIPRETEYPTLNILFSEEWKKDSYRVSGILKVIRNWDRLVNIPLIKSAGLFDRSLDDFLYIALEGKLDKVNRNCPFTGWVNGSREAEVHGLGGIYSANAHTELESPNFLRKTNMKPLLTKIKKEIETYAMPEL